MLWQEEALEQAVHPQQPFARQGDTLLAALGDETISSDRIERIAEALQDVDLILVAEVCRTDRTELQLQDELADQALFVRRVIGTIERDLVAYVQKTF